MSITAIVIGTIATGTAITGARHVMAVPDRDTTARECTIIAIAIETTGVIVLTIPTPAAKTATSLTVNARRAIVMSMAGAAPLPIMAGAVALQAVAIARQGIEIAAIRATVRTVTARLLQITMRYLFDRAEPQHAPIKRDAAHEGQKT